jgi:co-chaperonin GroES (HSP10)
MQPLKDNVLVKRTNQEQEQNGIILTAKQVAQNEGVVLAVGPKVESVKEGDLVVFVAAKTEVRIDGEPVLVMREEDIVAVKTVD